MVGWPKLIVATAMAFANLTASAAPITLNFEVTADTRIISSVAPSGRVSLQPDPGFSPVTFNREVIFDSVPTSSFGPETTVRPTFSNTFAATFFGLPSLPDSPFSESLRATNDLGPTSSWGATGTIGSQSYNEFHGSHFSSMEAIFDITEQAFSRLSSWTYQHRISLSVFSPFSSPDDVEMFSEESFLDFLFGLVGTTGAYSEGFTRMNSSGIVGLDQFGGVVRLLSVQAPTPVPEPGTLPLLALAVCCIVFFRQQPLNLA